MQKFSLYYIYFYLAYTFVQSDMKVSQIEHYKCTAVEGSTREKCSYAELLMTVRLQATNTNSSHTVQLSTTMDKFINKIECGVIVGKYLWNGISVAENALLNKGIVGEWQGLAKLTGRPQVQKYHISTNRMRKGRTHIFSIPEMVLEAEMSILNACKWGRHFVCKESRKLNIGPTRASYRDWNWWTT